MSRFWAVFQDRVQIVFKSNPGLALYSGIVRDGAFLALIKILEFQTTQSGFFLYSERFE